VTVFSFCIFITLHGTLYFLVNGYLPLAYFDYLHPLLGYWNSLKNANAVPRMRVYWLGGSLAYYNSEHKQRSNG